MSSEASTALTCKESTLEEKFKDGWVHSFSFFLPFLLIAIIAHATNTMINAIYFMRKTLISGLVYKSDGTWTGAYNYFETRPYGFTLFVLALVSFILAVGLFFQFLAIKQKDLEKQTTAINIATYFIGAQIRAVGFNVFFALFSAGASTFSALLAGLMILAVGMAFKFLALNVQNIMLGKAEEPFKFDKEAITKFKIMN